jgi:putative NADPH-quinone reductase
MRVVVVVAHPDPDSFNHAIASTAISSLTRAGHAVTVLDLYAEEFRTAMSRDEQQAYYSDRPLLDPTAERHAGIIKQAEALVFVYPTWWSTVPAILKGWLERVMVPGVGFLFDERQRVRRGLTDVRRVVGISTYGATRLYVKVLHDNGRRTLMRALRLNTALVTRTTWVALYEVDNCSLAQRQAFLERVDRKMRWL